MELPGFAICAPGSAGILVAQAPCLR